MNTELDNTKDFLQQVSDWIRFFVRDTLSGGWIMQFLFKFLFWGLIIYAIDVLLKTLINFVFRFFSNEEQYPVWTSIRKARVTNSVAHIIALAFGNFSLYSIFYIHKESYPVLERIVEFVLVVISAGTAFRVLKAVEYYYFIKKDHYRLMGVRAISQTAKIFGIFIFSVIGICVIFGISGTTILGSLGAITAVLVLVFRDTILGFVTGIHVATSKNLKVGDWVGIPKYNLEGTIEDINLLTTKILNFDKTISTIPTYDLLTTEIKNHQIMYDGSMRRIKRAIFFNIKSFKFVDDEMYERLNGINLISDYLKERYISLKKSKENLINNDLIINGEQLTNIGVFRNYALNYLKSNPNINQNDILLVRQLEITPQGLPLEIYCFANKAELVDYERVQADIFDHLLTAAAEFDLEIMQVNKI